MPAEAALPVLPRHCHNTAVSCLHCLSTALQLGHSQDDIAGLSGEAFRLPVFANCMPGAWQHSVGWPHAARHWLDAIGIDAEICWIDGSSDSIDNWLGRQRVMISETLARGLPVMYWDNLAWALILSEDPGGYEVSGVPDLHIPGLLLDGNAIQQRAYTAAGHVDNSPFHISHEQLRPMFETELLFIHPYGRQQQDPDYVLATALRRASDELAGRVRWPRQSDSSGKALLPLFGTAAMERLAQDMRSSEVALDGLIQTFQYLFEMRVAARQWLSALEERVEPQLRARIRQAAEFTRRISSELRPLATRFAPPADPLRQLERDVLRDSADALYEIRRTEETLTRLLLGISREFGVFE